MRVISLVFLLCAAIFCSAQSTPSTSGAPKEIPSFDVTAIDKTIEPCVDFYQYACGNWVKNNPVPPDKSRWGRFDGLAEQNLFVLRDILVQAEGTGQQSATEKRVGNFYAAC